MFPRNPRFVRPQYKPTQQEVRDAARLVCAFKETEMNARGYASVTQIRNRLFTRLGRQCDPVHVETIVKEIFPKVEAHPGYYHIDPTSIK